MRYSLQWYLLLCLLGIVSVECHLGAMKIKQAVMDSVYTDNTDPGPPVRPDSVLVANVTSFIRVELLCDIDPIFCEKVMEALSSAAREFSLVINIKSSIAIHVSYYSFCNVGCRNSTYGWGTPASQFTLPFQNGMVDPNYVYPQALAKQLAPYGFTSAWADYDVEMEINHDPYMNAVDYDDAYDGGWNGSGVPPGGKYWFKNNETSIGDDQIDMEYLLLHEIIHGAGFISSWAAYFANHASPFRAMVTGLFEKQELELVTPNPYWYVNQQGGPTYLTGFQPTMIFDKFLILNESQTNGSIQVDKLNGSLVDLAFAMEDFCVQDSNAFIVHFMQSFLYSDMFEPARQLWTLMSQPSTISFYSPEPNSTQTNGYRNGSYQYMVLATGTKSLNSTTEQSDRHFRTSASISHIDSMYASKPDFLMTDDFITGQTLESLVNDAYDELENPITYSISVYNDTTLNTTVIVNEYRSPIGPGILRMLDAMGYSTILTNDNYTSAVNSNETRKKSVCDDVNDRVSVVEPAMISTSNGFQNTIPRELLLISIVLAIMVAEPLYFQSL